ncbi:MAG TPA: hypothetical protein VNB22_17090 [Pyrinomonadaceae bacterium]|jgi:hypothetical protein|nr:hypothetical protein [Pyrinomonadaceae bacterium]
MDITFKISAVILAGIAAYFLWQGNADRAFAAAVFGAVSFFLSVRFQVKDRLEQRAAEREEEERRREEEAEFEEEIEEDETPQLNEMTASEQIDNQQRTADKEQI